MSGNSTLDFEDQFEELNIDTEIENNNGVKILRPLVLVHAMPPNAILDLPPLEQFEILTIEHNRFDFFSLLELMESRHPSLIVYECRILDAMRDLEMVRQIRKNNSIIPIICISQNDSFDYIRSTYQFGATDFVCMQDIAVLTSKIMVYNDYMKKVEIVRIQNDEMNHKIEEVLEAKKQAEDANIQLKAEIDQRIVLEKELRQHRDNLQHLVDERTKDLRAAIEEAETAKEIAEKATEIKSQFLANMSHEIRTPMNAIMGFSALLLEEGLTGEQQEHLTIIYSSAENLLGLINDILDVSKIEAGQVELEHIPFQLESTIRDMLALIAIKMDSNRVSLLCDLDPELPKCYQGDPARIRQLLINLLGNAVKFTVSGHIRLCVKAGELTDTCQSIVFIVEDTGKGMAEDYLPKLFQPFTQEDTSIMRTHGGTGLGLSISKKFVELMGGQISVQSKLGQGTQFLFTLRLSLAINNPLEKVIPASNLLDQKIIYILDPEDACFSTYEKVLNRLQGNIHRAKSYSDLHQMVTDAADNIDVIFVVYPTLNETYFTTLNELRQLPQLAQTRFIAGIFDTKKQWQQRLRQAGFHEVIIKPFTPSKFLDNFFRALAIEATQFHLQAPSSFANSEGTDHLVGKRVLIAEDNEFNQLLIKKLMKNFGCHCLIVNDGEEAIQAAGESPYDLILMDIQMPRCDGLRATKAIRAHGITTPILGLSAHAIQSEIDKALQAGMDDYITKPINNKVLRSTMARYVSSDVKSVPIVPLENSLAQEDPELFQFFIETVGDRIEAIAAALNENNLSVVKQIGHGLKGIGTTGGHPSVTELGDSLEQAGKSKNKENAASAFATLKRYYDTYLSAPLNPGEHPHTVQKPTLDTAPPPSTPSNTEDSVMMALPPLALEDPELYLFFIETVLDRINKLQIAFAENNLTEVTGLGHGLKGIGGTAGHQEITQLGKEIEDNGKAGNYDACRTVCNRLKDYVESNLTPHLDLVKSI